MRLLLLGLFALPFAPCLAAQAIPDTTAPWRYYPLHVGDAWEYSVGPEHRVMRREIERDTLIQGRRYAITRDVTYDAEGDVLQDLSYPVRFDTLTSEVRLWEFGPETEDYSATRMS
jgi:hypothetical protein